MKFLEKIRSRAFWQRTALPLMLVAIALVGGFGIYQYRRAHHLALAVENSYTRAFTELSESIEDMTVCLAKAMVISDTGEMIRLSSDIYRLADSAKVNLGALPMADEGLMNTEKFLSQVGNYCYSIALSHIKGTPVSAEETAELQKLYGYAKSLEDSLLAVTAAIGRGEAELWDKGAMSGAATLSQNFTSVEEEFREYPALIYDGPFSEHIEKKSSVFLAGLAEIDANRAGEILKSALGSRGGVLVSAGEENGKIPAYNFVGEVSEGREISAQITKMGGKLLWFLDDRQIYETKIEAADAISAAREFLKGQGYGDMAENYYEIKSNVMTVNFAATEGNITAYPDLVKVRVAMDNGEILGLEAKGYLMNHGARPLPDGLIGEDAARKKIVSGATVEESGLAFIPLESGNESLCYELKVRMEDRVFLVYVNAQTGDIDDLLMLLESPQGILTV